MKIFKDISSVSAPILEDGQLYVYVLENSPQGNIKIGVSKNIKQRLHSLSGSNGGGNQLVKCAISEPTYLYTLERILHSKFRDYRLGDSEWFDGEYVTFDMACNAVDELFSSPSYELCNEVRKKFGKTSNTNSDISSDQKETPTF